MVVPDVSERSLAELWSLAGRVAVVTGAGRGIGAAIASRLHEAGATVVVADIDGAAAEAQAASLGERAVASTVDVRSPEAVAALAETTVSAHGRLDVWVNNAGIFPHDDFLELSADQWDRVMEVNTRSAFLGSQAAAKAMVTGGRGGTIVNVASIAGLRGGRAGYVHYAASKHAVVGLTTSLANELGPRGIRVVGVAPSAIDTPGIAGGADDDGAFFREFGATLPVGRGGVPDDVARVVLFLASDMAMFVSGSTLLVDGGNGAR